LRNFNLRIVFIAGGLLKNLSNPLVAVSHEKYRKLFTGGWMSKKSICDTSLHMIALKTLCCLTVKIYQSNTRLWIIFFNILSLYRFLRHTAPCVHRLILWLFIICEGRVINFFAIPRQIYNYYFLSIANSHHRRYDTLT